MDTVKTKGKMTWQDYGAVCSQALAGVGTMLNALSNEQDASTEEGFKQTKKLQIAASVMNMLSGIVSAWTSAMNPANAWMTLPGWESSMVLLEQKYKILQWNHPTQILTLTQG